MRSICRGRAPAPDRAPASMRIAVLSHRL